MFKSFRDLLRVVLPDYQILEEEKKSWYVERSL